MLVGLKNLMFPNLCAACDNTLLKNETHLCTSCTVQLPCTNFHVTHDNPVSKVFWGRVKVESAFAYLHFRKEGVVQKMLHAIKYNGYKELATHLGVLYGNDLKKSELSFDGIVPVPLHPTKLRVRGYNQSEYFAMGLSQSMSIPLLTHAVQRITATESQTRKGRFDRWMNVKEVFQVAHPEEVEDKHILICDDVITTGATLEGLIQVLPKNTKVSVCTIAAASH
jgi:ComF family protein